MQRLQALFLLQINCIRICLAALPHILEDKEHEDDVQISGLKAANSILDSRQHQTPPVFDKLWGTTACISAACVYVILDLICFRNAKNPNEIMDQTMRIQLCIQTLQHDREDSQERVHTLKQLRQIGENWPADRPLNKHSLFQIMKLARTPTTDPVFEDTAPNISSTISIPANQAPPAGGRLGLASIPLFSYSVESNHDSGQDWEGIPMNYDFMRFDDMDSYPHEFDSEWDVSTLLDLSPGQRPY